MEKENDDLFDLDKIKISKTSEFYSEKKFKITEDSTLFNIKFEKGYKSIIRFLPPSPYSGKTMYYQSMGRTQRSGSMIMTFEMGNECIIKKYLDSIK